MVCFCLASRSWESDLHFKLMFVDMEIPMLVTNEFSSNLYEMNWEVATQLITILFSWRWFDHGVEIDFKWLLVESGFGLWLCRLSNHHHSFVDRRPRELFRWRKEGRKEERKKERRELFASLLRGIGMYFVDCCIICCIPMYFSRAKGHVQKEGTFRLPWPVRVFGFRLD